MFQRIYDYESLSSRLEAGKVLVIYGPRRAGKTTLIQQFLRRYPDKYLLTTGEDRDFQAILASESVNKIKNSFSDYTLLVVDEGQAAEHIGLGLKIIVDHIPGIRVIATGSSSFELANKMGEPLTGRQTIITLFPLSAIEFKNQFGAFELAQKLPDFLIYGSYPEALSKQSYDEKAKYLRTLVNSYLYKDILELEQIRNSKKLKDLVTLLAFQIGKEVSINELATQLGLAKQTVDRYLDLLEKSFVIFKLRAFSRNLRKEVSKTARYYFYDTGIRNAVINNFNSLELRNDVGELWENYLFMERMKKLSYLGPDSNLYFWRTYDQKEIDLVEERGGHLFGYEFKYGKRQIKVPKDWKKAYPTAEFSVIDRDNYLEFIT